MSVYPKHVVNGDNVVIHTRVNNNSPVSLPVRVNLIVVNKTYNYKKTILKDRLCFVPPSENGQPGIIERYFMVNTSTKMLLGKYDCLLSIQYLNKTEESRTRKNAFFYIEKIKIIKKNGRIFVKNLSKLNTKIKIFCIGEIYSRELKSLELVEITKKNFLYIVYANNSVLF